MALITCTINLFITVIVLKFRTLVACQKGLDKQRRPRSEIRVFTVCYSKMHFVNSSPDIQYFICEKRMKNV